VGPSLEPRVSRRFGLRHRTTRPAMGQLQIRGHQVYWIGYEHPRGPRRRPWLLEVRPYVGLPGDLLIHQPNGWAVIQRPRAPGPRPTVEVARRPWGGAPTRGGPTGTPQPRRLRTAVKPTHVVRRHRRGERLERRRFACCG